MLIPRQKHELCRVVRQHSVNILETTVLISVFKLVPHMDVLFYLTMQGFESAVMVALYKLAPG